MEVCYTAFAATALLIAGRRWLWLPVRSHRRSYVVEDVRPVSGNAVTVAVRAHEHGGLPFRAGQFAWPKIGASPFVFEEHPFTIASTAERPHIKEFTIKARGDFSELLIGPRPSRLDLAIVEVVESHPLEWGGESGRIDSGLLDRVLPRRARHHD
jgi:predicted ferric reductase